MASQDPFELTVSGRSEIPHHAERALIHVKISSSGTNQASVVDEVLTTTKHIEGMLRDLSPRDKSPSAKETSPLAHWSKTSMSSTSRMPRDENRKELPPRIHSSSLNFDIRFKEFKALGIFATDISSVPHVEVERIDWILTDTTEDSYQPQLRREAAKDAMEKAKDYCEVLNCTNLRPRELKESRYSSYSPGSKMAKSYRHMQSPNPEESYVEYTNDLEFTPQEVRMSMNVEIKFNADAVGGGNKGTWAEKG